MTRLFHNTRVFWLLGLPVVLVLLFLTVFGSRILINPGVMTVTPCGSVVLFRSYPMADLFGLDYPMVRYVTTVTPLTPGTNDGYVCREDNGQGQVYNHDHERGYGQWSIHHYAEDCMTDPVGFRVHTQYTALLFGAIPLRPISVTAVSTPTNGDRDTCSSGRQGPQGEPGPQGEQGIQGEPGRPGRDGAILYAPQYRGLER